MGGEDLDYDRCQRMSVSWLQLANDTVSDFFEDKVPRLGAAPAFYATFSIVPLLMLSASVASLFFGADAVEGQLKHQLIDLLGNDGAEGIQAMIAAAEKAHRSGIVSSIVGIGALLFGATGVFIELKASMNSIWGVEVRPELGFWGSIMDSAFAFVMVISIAILLLGSMILTAMMSTLSHTMHIHDSAHWTDFAVSSTVTTLLTSDFSLLCRMSRLFLEKDAS